MRSITLKNKDSAIPDWAVAFDDGQDSDAFVAAWSELGWSVAAETPADETPADAPAFPPRPAAPLPLDKTPKP